MLRLTIAAPICGSTGSSASFRSSLNRAPRMPVGLTILRAPGAVGQGVGPPRGAPAGECGAGLYRLALAHLFRRQKITNVWWSGEALPEMSR